MENIPNKWFIKTENLWSVILMGFYVGGRLFALMTGNVMVGVHMAFSRNRILSI